MQTTDTPIFPLSTVLYPGGHLGLRIFEPRYLDLVRECTGSGRPFGVCALLDGEAEAADPEIGQRSSAATTGTLARIIDFNTQPDGLLGIQAVGERRFQIGNSWIASNGLLRADIALLDEPEAMPVPPEYGLIATLLGRLLEQAGSQLPPHLRQQLDDASWLGYRMGELLPLSINERQLLLETDDPAERLQELLYILPRFQRE